MSNDKGKNDTQPRCRVYLLTPPAISLDRFGDDLARALDGGDVACMQLRLKDAPDDDVRRACETLMPIAIARDVAFLVNDRPDLAHEMGADGCHVGQDDMPYRQARALMGPEAIVGVTCHASRHLAMTAADAGADYVAFGAFYDTATKTPKDRAEPEILEWWSGLMEIPCVAIGGINAANAAPLVAAGADFICVSAGIWSAPEGPAAAVAALNEAIDRAGSSC
ncbi:thiamine phosphate synthase [Oceanibacterium hippocampi]|uniref:Thiamine-phosphate synthase n=1 Tax=Oceanibacterium hippocampi TaxID=745714 RepID=A0A1Y5TXX7_9PROT|nr:thiamine phosphate synthase [Oceanibacterium hippocampi]SLN73486.1 Thiamine-phosphate synthase [Oceanibacterium hippocampi]